MAKYHLDRLKKKFGWTGKNYRQLMTDIIEVNSLALHRATGRIAKENFEKTAKKVSTKETRLVLPDVSEALPKRSVFSRKAAVQGDLMTDKMRDRVTKSLRQVFTEFTPRSGEPAFVLRTGERRGRVNPKLVKQFERAITEDFAGYRRVDPAYGVPANINTIAVTEVRSVADEMKYEYAKKLALKNYEDFEMQKKWIHNKSLSENPRPHHMAANGMTVGFYDWFVLSNGARLRFPHDPEADPNEVIACLTPEQYVWGQPELAMRSEYSGDVYTIQTRSGLELTVTPNHPILTNEGWVPAESLKIGINVVCVDHGKLGGISQMDVKNRPAVIDEIFNLSQLSGPGVRKGGGDRDFHGEGREGQVYVVPVDSQLWNELKAERIEHALHGFFSGTNETGDALPRDSNPAPFRIRSDATFGRKMSRSRVDGALLGSHVCVSGKLSSRAGALEIADACHSVDNRSAVAVELGGDRENRHSGLVHLDDIVGIDVRPFLGHVYNLHTKQGWYVAQRQYSTTGIICSNCHCDYDILIRRLT